MGTKDKSLSEIKTKLQGIRGRLELNKNLRHEENHKAQENENDTKKKKKG